MNFKSYYIQSQENIENFYESLFEASETFYTLTSNGLMQLFDKSFDTPPKVSKATKFLIYNPSNEDDRKKLLELKKKNGIVKNVMYVLTNSRINKPSIDSNIFNVPKEFFTFDQLKPSTPEQKELLKVLDGRWKEKKSKFDVEVKDDEIVTFLDMLKSTTPSKFTKGVYYIYNVSDNDLYEVLYNKKDSKFSFDSLFEIAKSYQGPESDEKFEISKLAQQMEDVQALGVYFDAEEVANKIIEYKKENKNLAIPYDNKSFRPIVKPFENALNASDEYRRFNEIIKRDYKNFGYDDWLNVCMIAGGMAKFINDHVQIKSPYIVFKSMPEYKQLEVEKTGEKELGKLSTAEILVSTVPAKDLLNLISKKDTKLVPEHGYIKVEDADGKQLAKYWQVILKENLGSKIGRSQRFFGKVYDMTTKAKEVFESYKEYDELLNEGILEKLSDAAKKGATFLKSIGKKLYDKIKFLILALKDWGITTRENIIKFVSKNVVNDALELYGKPLSEDVKNEINELIKELLNDGNKNWDIGNKKIETLANELTKNKKNEIALVTFTPIQFTGKITPEMFKNQIFNYSFMKAFKQIIYNSKSPIESYVDEVLDLYIEAVYGGTKLPIWKVYSTVDGHKPYEFIGTKESTKEERKKGILKGLGKEGMPVIVLDIIPSRGYHGITLATLSNIISENGKFEPIYTFFYVSHHKDNLVPSFQAVKDLRLDSLKDR